MNNIYTSLQGKLLGFLKTVVIVLVLMGVGVKGWGQGAENFENIPASSGTYASRSWTGTNSVTWTATLARTDQTLTTRAICTNGSGTVTSPSYTGGMGTLSFNYVRAFTGTSARSIQVWVNGVQQGSTITVSPTSDAIVNYSQVLNITGSIVLEFRTSGAQIKIDDVVWTAYSAASAPEINLKGNTVSILNNDNTPSTTDDTDFGATAVTGGTIAKTFTIENLGSANLSLTGTSPYVAISGADAADFSVTANPTTPISAAGTTTFTVTFDPSALGARNAILTIANDDADENPYVFSITGTGVNSSNSDIITDGTYTYTSNINYTLYQGAPASNTTNSVGAFKFTIRDGGAGADADALGTELSSLTFNVTNIANIRSAAIFGGASHTL